MANDKRYDYCPVFSASGCSLFGLTPVAHQLGCWSWPDPPIAFTVGEALVKWICVCFSKKALLTPHFQHLVSQKSETLPAKCASDFVLCFCFFFGVSRRKRSKAMGYLLQIWYTAVFSNSLVLHTVISVCMVGSFLLTSNGLTNINIPKLDDTLISWDNS